MSGPWTALRSLKRTFSHLRPELDLFNAFEETLLSVPPLVCVNRRRRLVSLTQQSFRVRLACASSVSCLQGGRYAPKTMHGKGKSEPRIFHISLLYNWRVLQIASFRTYIYSSPGPPLLCVTITFSQRYSSQNDFKKLRIVSQICKPKTIHFPR